MYSRKKLSVALLAMLSLMFLTQAICAWAQGPFQQGDKGYLTYKDLVWMEMQQNNPFLYRLVVFLNPAWLNSAFGSVMTLFAAVISIVLLISFEHMPGLLRLFITAVTLYSWARIFCFFLLMAILEKGTVVPLYFK